MTQPIVVLCQPLYGAVLNRHHGRLCQWIVQNIAAGYLHWYNFFSGAYIDEAFNRLVADTLDNIPEATHVLFVEQDMILPDETLEALLSAEKDVVSATYFYHDADATLVGFSQLGPPGRWLETFVEDEVQQVAGVGCGCLLVRCDVFRQMERCYGDRLWFQCQQISSIIDGTDEAKRRTKGQDWHFCKRLETMGVPVYLDGRVVCGHISEGEVGLEQHRRAQERKSRDKPLMDNPIPAADLIAMGRAVKNPVNPNSGRGA